MPQLRSAGPRAHAGARRSIGAALGVMLALGTAGPARAQAAFPHISFRAFAGVPSSTGADSTVSRKVTIRWARDRAAEARPDFGGYRIYRQSTVRDTTNMDLLRRFAVRGISRGDTLANGQTNPSIYARRDTLLWHFPDSQDTLQFVDPDSTGNLVKVCRRLDPRGNCASPGDSVFKLVAPPGPHDGFALYYTITYGTTDQTLRETSDMFVPDTLDAYARCNVPGVPSSCPNLNGKLTNLMTAPVYVTGPTTANVEGVVVIPNPYRGHDRWDQPGEHRVQFQNLPARARVRVYTIAGDLVRDLEKNDTVSGSLDWDLMNADHRDVASGIYVYQVTSSQGFEAKGHFVIIR
ncbi:MAG: hypothetical protein ABI960_11140 [Candidatus Eisenbacteria bacterium]